MQDSYRIKGKIVDVPGKTIFNGAIEIEDGRIASIKKIDENVDQYIMPGFIDAHIHIESSMLVPSEFARIAVVHGTVATVSDPHEIANVSGIDGVNFMIENGKKVPFHFYFGAPSCVPATSFETSGASINAGEIRELLKRDDIKYLSEMMNFPGVINNDPEVLEKISASLELNKPVDGHAPGLQGEDLIRYVKAGISTDHECTSIREAEEKIRLGMKILIREGSAARDFEALYQLIDRFPESVMLCSDDRHPDDLQEGHINLLVKRALRKNLNLFNVLRACTMNPVKHYGLDTGLLGKGHNADFIICDDLQNLNIRATYISGVKVAEYGKSLINSVKIEPVNRFLSNSVKKEDIRIKATSGKMNVIGVVEGQLYTEKKIKSVKIEKGFAVADPDKDICKIVVVNRYRESRPAVGFITGFGLRSGAIASTVAHDSHNIIAVGTSDEEIITAINLIISSRGGISIVHENIHEILPLPVGGLMSVLDGYEAAKLYKGINQVCIDAGIQIKSPFMALSFMALLVIPSLKISDQGLFDGDTFRFVPLFA